MEAHEDTNSSSSTGESLCPVIIKRKRTKRCRTLLPPPPADDVMSASSGTTTTEEEDMANCLMLLAQGRTSKANVVAAGRPSRTGSDGFFLYECKTCSKCFSSFQALGGHRASHKKPKMVAKMETVLVSPASKLMASVTSGGKPRKHECSICGAAFFSGQALGGHMRRHRPAILPEINKEVKPEKNPFSLDLNLPAPADDDHCPENPLIFSPPPAAAAALVNCYY